MARFSNGTEGMYYQERYCYNCKYWVGDIDNIGSDLGCPIWFLHELHVGEPDWQPVLDKLIPMKGLFAGECSTFWKKSRP